MVEDSRGFLQYLLVKFGKELQIRSWQLATPFSRIYYSLVTLPVGAIRVHSLSSSYCRLTTKRSNMKVAATGTWTNKEDLQRLSVLGITGLRLINMKGYPPILMNTQRSLPRRSAVSMWTCCPTFQRLSPFLSSEKKTLNPDTTDRQIEGAHETLTIFTTTDEDLDILMWKLTERHKHVLLYFWYVLQTVSY